MVVMSVPPNDPNKLSARKIDQKWTVFWDNVRKRAIIYFDLFHTIAIQVLGSLGGLVMVGLSSIMGWVLRRGNSSRGSRLFFLIPALIGLTLAGIVSAVTIVFVLIAGSLFSFLGYRNIGEYTLREQVAAWFIMVALIFAAPLFLSEYAMFKVCLILAYAIGVIGVDFLFGQCGILSLGHSGFMMFGGYLMTWLYNGDFGFQFPIFPSILIAGLSMALVGVLLGIPFLRVKDFYLAIVTMAFALAVPKILTCKYMANLSKHRDGGIFLRENSSYLANWMSSPVQNYFVIVTCSLILIFIAYNITHNSQIGRAFKAIRCDDEVSMIAGIPIVRYKLFAFALSGVYAGFSGALLVYASKFVSHEAFSLFTSVDMIAANIVGGPGGLLGSFLGGIYLTYEIPLISWLGQNIPRGDALARAFYGLVPVLVIYFLPKGLAGEASHGLGSLFFHTRIRRGLHRVAPPPDYDLLGSKRKNLPDKVQV